MHAEKCLLAAEQGDSRGTDALNEMCPYYDMIELCRRRNWSGVNERLRDKKLHIADLFKSDSTTYNCLHHAVWGHAPFITIEKMIEVGKIPEDEGGDILLKVRSPRRGAKRRAFRTLYTNSSLRSSDFVLGSSQVCGDGERVDVYKVVEVISGGLPWEEDGFFEDSWSSVGGELARSVSSDALTGSIIVPPQSPTRKPATPQSAYSPRLDDSTALLDSGSILLEGEEVREIFERRSISSTIIVSHSHSSQVEEGEERMMSSDDFIDAYILSYSVAPLKTLQHIHALGWRGLKEAGEEKVRPREERSDELGTC